MSGFAFNGFGSAHRRSASVTAAEPSTYVCTDTYILSCFKVLLLNKFNILLMYLKT